MFSRSLDIGLAALIIWGDSYFKEDSDNLDGYKMTRMTRMTRIIKKCSV